MSKSVTVYSVGEAIRRRRTDRIDRCPRCGAGFLGNCGAYGAEIPRGLCPHPAATRAALPQEDGG